MIKKQNNKSSLIFLKCLAATNFNIKDSENVSILLLINNYFTRFKHAYWANFVKLCVKHTEPGLIKFIKSYNDLD